MSILFYQFPISHYCEKVRWALAHKKIQHKTINLLPGFHIKTILKIAKNSSVPLIKDGELVIQDSAQIISYFDDKFHDNQLTPSDDELKKQAMQWEKYVDTELGDHVRRVCYHILLDHPDIVIPFFTHNGPWYGALLLKIGFKKLQYKMRHYMKINQDSAAHSQQQMALAIDKIDQHLQQRDYLVGEQFSRADLAAASLLAPLCQPAGYGLNWPKKTPAPLQEIADKYQEKLAWVHHIYQQYRSFPIHTKH